VLGPISVKKKQTKHGILSYLELELNFLLTKLKQMPKNIAAASERIHIPFETTINITKNLDKRQKNVFL